MNILKKAARMNFIRQAVKAGIPVFKVFGTSAKNSRNGRRERMFLLSLDTGELPVDVDAIKAKWSRLVKSQPPQKRMSTKFIQKKTRAISRSLKNIS